MNGPPEPVALGAGFAVASGRQAKALKIMRVLEEGLGRPLDGLRLLDVGTGSGEIAHILGQQCELVSIDPADQRQHVDGYRYVRAGTALPFAQASFDVAISNHVIEHLDDAPLHLQELSRVVRPGGLVYLATPNRWWPWEVHYRLPLLHYLPRTLFWTLLRRMGRFHEPLHLLGSRSLQRLAFGAGFAVTDCTPMIIRQPRRYHLDVADWLAALLGFLPHAFYQRLRWAVPTLIFLLKRAQRP